MTLFIKVKMKSFTCSAVIVGVTWTKVFFSLFFLHKNLLSVKNRLIALCVSASLFVFSVAGEATMTQISPTQKLLCGKAVYEGGVIQTAFFHTLRQNT